MYLEREGTSKASEAKWPRVKTGRGWGKATTWFSLAQRVKRKEKLVAKGL